MRNTLYDDSTGPLIRIKRTARITRLCMKYQKELHLRNISIKAKKKFFYNDFIFKEVVIFVPERNSICVVGPV